MIYFVTSVRLLEFPNFYIDLICSEKALEDSINELNDSAAQEAFTQQAVSLITLRFGCLNTNIFTDGPSHSIDVKIEGPS